MGGGGGLFGGGYDPDKYKEIVQKTREQTKDAQFDAKVNEVINNLLSENEREIEITNEHINELKSVIEEEGIGTFEMRFGGSVKKHTYVDGLSDIDIIVEINKTDLLGVPPQKILKFIEAKLAKVGAKNIKEINMGKLAVTVRFEDGHEIQLLPAIKLADGFRIPSSRGNEWSNIIRPDRFASKLTEINQNCGGKVVPMIKLVKGIIGQLPEDQRLTGYHTESIAIEVFKSYPESEPKTSKTMLRYFFEHAKEVVKYSIKDKTNQSIHVDDYLGSENSAERLRISYALDRIARKIKQADELKSIDIWSSILGE
jgi:predicted transcriptional regulator